MFSYRIQNPYETMPFNPEFKIIRKKEILDIIDRILKLQDLSTYLVEKVIKSWDDRIIRKQSKGHNLILDLEIVKEFQLKRQRKYEKNLESFNHNAVMLTRLFQELRSKMNIVRSSICFGKEDCESSDVALEQQINLPDQQTQNLTDKRNYYDHQMDFLQMAEKLQRKEVKINTRALGLVLKATIKVVEKINQDLIIISSEMGRMSDSSVKQFITGLSWFKIIQSQIIPAIVSNKQDVWFQKPGSQDHQILKSIVKVVDVANEQKYKQELNQFIRTFISIATADAREESKINDFGDELNSKLRIIGRMALYKLTAHKSQINYMNWLSTNEDFNKYINFFNMPDTNFVAKITNQLTFEQIETAKTIYVPMLAKIFDKQESDGYEKKSTSSYKEKIVKPNDSTCYTLDQATFNPESMVRVLLLFNQRLYFKNTKIPTSIGPLKAKISKVIVHFHGGAFVSQSAYSHQSYTRRLANECGVPIFSVDYRLAPQNPYPDPENDAYQGYYWVMTQAKEHFGMDVEKVVLIGDSAGSKLCVSVCLIAILRQFRIPDGVILPYPATTSDTSYFMPSSLISIDDFLLQANMIMQVNKAYVSNQGDVRNNFVLSPMRTPKELLAQLCPVRLLVSEIDPLRDQGVQFGLQLKKSGVDIEIFYMKQFVHGFLCFESPIFGVPSFRIGSNIVIRETKILLGL